MSVHKTVAIKSRKKLQFICSKEMNIEYGSYMDG